MGEHIVQEVWLPRISALLTNEQFESIAKLGMFPQIINRINSYTVKPTLDDKMDNASNQM